MLNLNSLHSILWTWFYISYMFLEATTLDIERINLISPISLRSESVIYHENTTKKTTQENKKIDQEIGRERFQSSLINDRLAEIIANQEIQKQKLSLIEYKLMTVDVKSQEKLNSVQRQIADVMNRMQEIDWQGSNLEGAIETLRAETSGLKQALDYQKFDEGCTSDTVDIKMNLVMLTIRGITSQINNLRESVKNINTNMLSLNKNTSSLLTITRNLSNTCAIRGQQLQPLIKDNSDSVPREKLSNKTFPKDCFDVMRSGITVSSIYEIQPSEYHEPFLAVCDMDTMGGGWTVFQNRYDGSTHFFRDWTDYKTGFGNMAEEFWLGLDKLHTITNSRMNDLLVNLEDLEGQKAWAYYEQFSIGNSDQDYAITSLGHYHGNSGDSLRSHTYKFSTQDRDNDMNEAINCARSGAWWYLDCEDIEQYSSSLNGLYLNGTIPQVFPSQGMLWTSWRGIAYSLPSTRLMVRPSADIYKPQTKEKSA